MTSTENIYKSSFEIPSFMIDSEANLTMHSLFMIFQEIGEKHATNLGISWHKLKEKGFFWVLSRIRIEINRMPKWTETVSLESWIRESETATSPRDFLIRDTDGQVLVAGRSLWAILDSERGMPQRMSNFDDFLIPCEKSAVSVNPQKVKALQLPENLPEIHKVASSDIDMNHHVNNARYIQWAFDSMSEEFKSNHKIDALTINFLSAAKIGDSYSVYSEQTSDNELVTSIFSPDSRKEFCRISSQWQSSNDNSNKTTT